MVATGVIICVCISDFVAKSDGFFWLTLVSTWWTSEFSRRVRNFAYLEFLTAFYGEMESLNMSKLNLSSVRGNTSKESGSRVETFEAKLDNVSYLSSLEFHMWYFRSMFS